jgi:hypothetical protein
MSGEGAAAFLTENCQDFQDHSRQRENIRSEGIVLNRFPCLDDCRSTFGRGQKDAFRCSLLNSIPRF